MNSKNAGSATKAIASSLASKAYMASDDDAKQKERTENQKKLDVRAAQNLYRLWREYQAKHGVTQDDFATNMLGWSQGNFSQYLNGKTPIGRKSLLKLCEAFNCQPGDIREEFKDLESEYTKAAVSQLLSIVSKYEVSEADSIAIKAIRENMAA